MYDYSIWELFVAQLGVASSRVKLAWDLFCPSWSVTGQLAAREDCDATFAEKHALFIRIIGVHRSRFGEVCTQPSLPYDEAAARVSTWYYHTRGEREYCGRLASCLHEHAHARDVLYDPSVTLPCCFSMTDGVAEGPCVVRGLFRLPFASAAVTGHDLGSPRGSRRLSSHKPPLVPSIVSVPSTAKSSAVVQTPVPLGRSSAVATRAHDVP
eukprot:IDg5365t1